MQAKKRFLNFNDGHSIHETQPRQVKKNASKNTIKRAKATVITLQRSGELPNVITIFPF
jgi:hypothetical protein